MSAWDEVDRWRNRALDKHFARDVQLMRYGWFLLPSEGGEWNARRIKDGDEPGGPRDGKPEATAQTFEILLATVQALSVETEHV